MGSRPVKPGLRLVDGKLSILQEPIDDDKQLPEDFRTARLLREVANTITPMIRMKEDVPSNHQSRKLPILDLEVWVRGHTIFHQYYQKPMASRVVVQASSAFSTSKKRSILLEEGLRRLRNCSPELEWKEKVVFLHRFSGDLKRSGHVSSFRRTVLRRVIIKYKTDLTNHVEGNRLLYRPKAERDQQQMFKKMVTNMIPGSGVVGL